MVSIWKKRFISEAIEATQKAIELDPKEAYFYSQLSLCYLGKELYNEAIKTANQAIELDPGRESLFAYFALGMSYAAKNEIAESKRLLKKVIELDPQGEYGMMAEFTLMMWELLESKE